MAKEDAAAPPDGMQIADSDRDALHILPLQTVIIDTPALKRARMIKNAQLNAVVEIFSGRGIGSGQVDVQSLKKDMGWPDDPPHPDHMLLRKLSQLPSFDVYSLRILFRNNNIPIREDSALKLSEGKVKELTAYMTQFTRPLMREVYQSEDIKVDTLDDMLNLFRNPDVKLVQERLRMMAEKLGISIGEIPNFLEDYGDIFLSFSYYRNCLDKIVPTIQNFISSINSFKTNFQLSRDVHLMKTCEFMEATINELLASITGRFESFDRSTEAIWTNLSAEKFRKVEALIRGYHTNIGGVLCALSVKMYAWEKLFPNRNVGGPLRRAEFVMSDMRHGLDRIQVLESQAPAIQSLQ